MGPLANSNDPDEMQHDAAFHQDLHCLLKSKQPSGTDIHHVLETSTCDPSNTKSTSIVKTIRIRRIKQGFRN